LFRPPPGPLPLPFDAVDVPRFSRCFSFFSLPCFFFPWGPPHPGDITPRYGRMVSPVFSEDPSSPIGTTTSAAGRLPRPFSTSIVKTFPWPTSLINFLPPPLLGAMSLFEKNGSVSLLFPFQGAPPSLSPPRFFLTLTIHYCRIASVRGSKGSRLRDKIFFVPPPPRVLPLVLFVQIRSCRRHPFTNAEFIPLFVSSSPLDPLLRRKSLKGPHPLPFSRLP